MEEKIFEIYLNFVCNQKCFMCFNSDSFRKDHPGLDFNTAAAAILRMGKKGCNSLSILGGEPTIHPEILKVVSFARKCGYHKIRVFSNGQRFSDPAFTGKLIQAGLTDAVISMHGHRAELHDAVTGVKGSFEKAVRGIQDLLKSGVPPCVVIVLNRKNYRSILDALAFFNSLGVKYFMIFFLKYQGRLLEAPERAKAYLVSMTEAFRDVKAIFEFSRKNKIPAPAILHVPPCIVAGYESNLDNYYPKPSEMLLQDGESLKLAAAHINYAFKKSCPSCVYFKGCTGFDRGYSAVFGTDEFKPVKARPEPFYTSWSGKELTTSKREKTTKTYRPPPDKSITLRALLLGAIARGRTVIRNPLFCADTAAMLACLSSLGVTTRVSRTRIIVEGRGLNGLARPPHALNAGEAGAVARLLAGVLAGQGFPSEITGAAPLRRRPMDRVAKPLALMGARIAANEGKLPFKVQPAPLSGITYTLPVASAQVKSAILLAGLYAAGKTVIKEPVPSRDHTERLLAHFGARLSRRGQNITLLPGVLKGARLPVPGDISAAAPFIAAALLSGQTLLVKNVGLNPSRLGLLKAMKAMGASFRITVKQRRPEQAGDILVSPGGLKSVRITAAEVPAMIDELPLLAVMAAAAEGKTVIHGADELRHKESDRIKATLALLRTLGARALYRGGALEITGPAPFHGGTADTFRDHRIAMAAAAAGARTATPLKIKDRGCVNKSYPAFFADFKKVFPC